MTWNPQLGVSQYQLYQNFKQTFIFLASGSFQLPVAYLFFYCLFATTPFYTVFGIL